MSYMRPLVQFGFGLFVALSLAVGNLSQIPTKRERAVTLPMDAVVSESGALVLDPRAGVGFIASVIPGSLISFSLRSGKILSSVQLGETACAPSIVEVGAERIIALPTSTGLESDDSSSVSIINATKADQFEKISSVALPRGVRLKPDSRALLTADGRFGVIAASSSEACLISFNAQTGQLVSRIVLYGDPSGIALADNAAGRIVAVVNSKLNNVFMSRLDEQGQLQPIGTFIPDDAQFEYSNQPEFGTDGRNLYIAASKGDRVYAIDANTCMLQASISVSAPQKVTIARGADGTETIGVTRLARQSDGRPGGVTILTNSDGRLVIRSEFSPSNEFQFSNATNIVFSSDAALGIVGSASGILLSFDTRTGKLVGYKVLGGELRRLLFNQTPAVVLAVRSMLTKDDVVLVALDQLEVTPKTQQLPRLKPEIKSISNEGTHVQLLIEGNSFRAGSFVQFVKEGKVVFQQSAVRITENQLTVVIPTKRLKEIGKCDIRVVTGSITATDFTPIEPLALLSSKPIEPMRKLSLEGRSLPRATVVNSVDSETEADFIRVIIRTDGEARLESFALSNPFRVVIDLLGVRNGFGNRTTPVNSALIQRIRTGCPKPGVVRIVLDTKSKVHYEVKRSANTVEILVREELALVRTNSSQ